MTVCLQIFLATLVATPVQVLTLWDHVATVRLEARLKAMRAAGEPTTLAEVARLYPDPPKGQNAARLLNAAFEQIDKLRQENAGEDLPIVGQADLPPAGQKLPPAMLRNIEAYLDLHAEPLALLHRGAALEHCKFDLEFEDGVGMLLPHLSHVRNGARLLALEVIARTEHGKPDAAADSLVAAIRLGHALRQEPVLITALVRIACDGIAIGQVQRWVARATPSPKALAKVQAALAAEADPKLLRNVFLAERCFGMDMYRNFVLDPKPGNQAELFAGMGGPPAMLIRAVPRAYFKMDMVHYIDLMSAHVTAARAPYPASLRAGARLGAELRNKIPRHYYVCRMVLPAIGRIFAAGQRHMAHCDSARLGLAALRYRAKHGKLPAKLDALAPDYVEALPPDPYTGKPLLLRKEKTGFVIYAVGENGTDDAGDIERANGKQPDVGFRYHRPKAQF